MYDRGSSTKAQRPVGDYRRTGRTADRGRSKLSPGDRTRLTRIQIRVQTKTQREKTTDLVKSGLTCLFYLSVYAVVECNRRDLVLILACPAAHTRIRGNQQMQERKWVSIFCFHSGHAHT